MTDCVVVGVECLGTVRVGVLPRTHETRRTGHQAGTCPDRFSQVSWRTGLGQNFLALLRSAAVELEKDADRLLAAAQRDWGTAAALRRLAPDEEVPF